MDDASINAVMTNAHVTAVIEQLKGAADLWISELDTPKDVALYEMLRIFDATVCQDEGLDCRAAHEHAKLEFKAHLGLKVTSTST